MTPEEQAAAAAAAKEGASANPTESAKLAESLRAAQDSAEAARKDTAKLTAMIEERDAQSEEFQEKIAALETQLKAGRGDDGRKRVPTAAELAAALRKQAAAGDVDSIGVLEAAREIAREELGAASLKERMDASFDQMEEFQNAKAKEHGFKTVQEFRDALDSFAAPFTNKLPHVQMQKAYEGWQREQSLSTREANITAKEKELGLWQDPGTGDGGGAAAAKKSDGKKSWRDSKSQAEKMADVGSL